MNWDWHYAWKILPDLLVGTGVTVLVTLASAAIALSAGCDLVLLCNQSLVDGGKPVDALLDGLQAAQQDGRTDPCERLQRRCAPFDEVAQPAEIPVRRLGRRWRRREARLDFAAGDRLAIARSREFGVDEPAAALVRCRYAGRNRRLGDPQRHHVEKRAPPRCVIDQGGSARRRSKARDACAPNCPVLARR